MNYNSGQIVGWRGERYVVVKVYEGSDYLTLLKQGDPIHKRSYAHVSDITDPPPLPDHVEQAVQEAIASGIFSDARRAIFGEES